MIHPSTNNYWIAPNAISITLNALDNTEYAEVICVSGAVIMCFMNGIEGLGYDAAHNYQSWTLVASPTCFGTTEQKYLYVKIPRSATAIANDPIAVEQGISAPKDQIHAYICFPSEEIDMYGCSHSHDGFDDDETTQVGSRDYFYVFLGGVISASVKSDGTSQQRRWLANPSTGTFNTDEGKDLGTSSWWEYSSMTDTVTFLKKLTMAAGTFFKKLYAEKLTFRNATQADLGTLESVATFSSLDQETTNASPTAAITEKYLADRQEETDSRYIRKDKDDDNGTHRLTLGSLKVNGIFDAFGNATFKDNAYFGQYEKALSGGRITPDGAAELKSLVLRESLTVPKLTYNCEEWIGGNTWRSQGGGIIKAVADITTASASQVSTGASCGDTATVQGGSAAASKHIALLDILANEGGKIAANDKCQGIFHITDPVSSGGDNSPVSSGVSAGASNATTDRDYHNGHFTFRGFTTIYFLVKEVMSDQWIEDNAQALKTAFNLTTEELTALKGMNAFFEYKLRSEVDTTWTDSTHPQPQLNFAAYANEKTASRQQVHLSTPQYDIYLVGMTQWTYAEENIQMILGLLDGFTLNRTKWDVAQGKFVDADPVSLTGYGIAFGKAYMWGNIEQFDRKPSLVSQQLYCKASASTTALTVAQIGTATDSQATEDLRYLWGYWHYLYSDGQTHDSNVFLAANYGKEGKDAVIYSLVPEQTGIKIASDGTYSEERLTVLVQKNEAGKVTPSINPSDANLKIYLIVDFEYEETDTDTLEGDDGEALDFGDDDNITYLNPIPFPEGGIILGGEGEGHISPQNNVKFILVDDSVTITDDYRGICIDTKTIPVSKDGEDGQPGKDGISISTVTEQYGVSAEASTQPSAWYDTLAEAQAQWNKTSKYLWNKETTKFNRDKEDIAKAHIITIYTEDGAPGKGISDIHNWYKASPIAEGMTVPENNSEWSQNPSEQTLTETDKYLWSYEEIIYTEGDNTYTTPRIVAYYNVGKQGRRGTSWNIIKWEDALEKMNESTEKVFYFYADNMLTDDISIADIVIYNNIHYLCIKPYTLTPANRNTTPPDIHDAEGNDCFRQFNEFSNIATGLLLADKALIHNLITENIILTDDDGNQYGGMILPQKDADKTKYGDIRFWIGGTNPQTAPTRITKDGKGYFDGILRSRGVDMRLTEIQVDDRQTTTRYTDFTYDYSRNVNIHNVDIEGEPYISVCHVAGTTGMRHDTDVDYNIMMNVMSWIILPYACEQIEGRVIEIYTPNFITRQTNEEYFLPIGITSSDNTTDEYNNNNWIDRTDAEDRNAIQSSLCLQWGGLSYTAAVMCSRKYAMTDDPSSVSRLRIICTKFMNGQHAIYKWMILESTNVRLCEYNNPLNLDN